MRQFLAIPLPEEVRSNAAAVTEPFRGIKGLRPVRNGNLHLTLLFIGDAATESRIEELRRIEFDPFTLSTISVKLFPERRPRLIWIEMKKSDELLRLYKRVAPVFDINERYTPHITLARIKWLSPEDKRIVAQEIDRANPFEMDFAVNGFSLYDSELKPGGPCYREIEKFCPVK